MEMLHHFQAAPLYTECEIKVCMIDLRFQKVCDVRFTSAASESNSRAPLMSGG